MSQIFGWSGASRGKGAVAAIAVIAAAVAVVALSSADSAAQRAGIGNHTLKGLYEFQADGILEVEGKPTRSFWEVGRFVADGKGNITGGREYSSMLSEDESVIGRPFSFSGTYRVNPNGVATGEVTVQVAPGQQIKKKLWLILHSIGRRGIANGFDGGHAHADLGPGGHGNALSHVGHRVHTAR